MIAVYNNMEVYNSLGSKLRTGIKVLLSLSLALVVTWSSNTAGEQRVAEEQHPNVCAFQFASFDFLVRDPHEIDKRTQASAFANVISRTVKHYDLYVYKHGRIIDPSFYLKSTIS